MRSITFSLEAAKALRRHGEVAAQLCAAIALNGADTCETGDRPADLSGSRRRTLFIGDFSVIFEDTDTARVVTKIGPRHR